MSDCWLWSHDWTKWESYKEHFRVSPGIIAPKEIRGKMFDTVEDWQKRKCLKCGKEQREEL